MSNIYQKHGYENRQEYLESLAEDYGKPQEVVNIMADLLGETEDFDGLVSELEDMGDMFYFD